MATILILFIYLSFVSLGLQSPLLGSVWPAAHAELSATTATAGVISTLTTGGTIVASLLSARIIAKLGPGRTAALAVFVTATGLMGYSVSGSWVAFCFIAIPMGLGGGMLDASINNYVATHYHYRQVNFLHAFWGAGATIGPILLSADIALGSWRAGYRTVSYVQYAVAILLLLSLPLWKRVAKAEGVESVHQELSYRAVLKKPGLIYALLTFLVYCAAESITSLWASTYLAETQGLTIEEAARAGALFFAGIMSGRLLCGLFASRLDTRHMIRIGIIGALAGIVPVLLNLSAPHQLVGLFFTGAGCGPIFPALVKLTPERFGLASSQVALGLEMAADYVGAMCLPPLFGIIANATTYRIYPYVLIVLLLTALLLQKPLDQRIEGGAPC